MSRRRVPLPRTWPALRREILERDGRRCYLCGAPASQVDHMLPAHLGGGDEPDNLAAICARCHASKTGREARAARPVRSRTRPPEPHPGLSGVGEDPPLAPPLDRRA